MIVDTGFALREPGAAVSALLDEAFDTAPALSADQRKTLADGHRAMSSRLAAGAPVYGLTHGFGPLVTYAGAECALDQGRGLIAHLATGQGEPLPPTVSRLAIWLRLVGMRQGHSAVAPEFWTRLADLWNAGFTPVMPSHGTVSASGDLQPLAHAALAFSGEGRAQIVTRDATVAAAEAGAVLERLRQQPVQWPAREALAFVNGTSVSLAYSMLNFRRLLTLARASAMLTGRVVRLLGASLEAYDDRLGVVRNHAGQRIASAWIRAAATKGHHRDVARPLQEPYSLRCAPQILGALVEAIANAETTLYREATGCTDNPVVIDEDTVLHGGNFHALPVALVSDQMSLCAQQIAFLADRQLSLLCDPTWNGGRNPMLTPSPGRSSGLAGAQLSATSFVSRVRQLASPCSLTALPTNLGNQDHVPMALNGAVSLGEALELTSLVIGSLGVATTQLHADTLPSADEELWHRLREISPPLVDDRPLAAEVRQCARVLEQAAADNLGRASADLRN